jgi:hypothetical protein
MGFTVHAGCGLFYFQRVMTNINTNNHAANLFNKKVGRNGFSGLDHATKAYAGWRQFAGSHFLGMFVKTPAPAPQVHS